MTETIINLETVNPIEFFGVNNGKLDLLKKKFPLLKILIRGTQIKLMIVSVKMFYGFYFLKNSTNAQLWVSAFVV